MGFNSAIFPFFLTIIFLGTLILRGKFRILFYTVMSYFFYSFSYPPYVIILLLSTIVDYHLAKEINRNNSIRTKKNLITISIILNVGVLCLFKYFVFFNDIINRLIFSFGLSYKFCFPVLILPIGISFYTFMSLSYVIDVYKGVCKPADSFLEYAFLISFFPHLVSGPILRAAEFLPTIKNSIPLREENVIRGVELVIRGFVKKLILADNIARVVDRVYSSPDLYGGLTFWVATISFAWQIYFDFSGYTDIARGLAKILGFEFPVNFKWPYISTSMREFWTRWHITLSAWIRDYLYIPLGGSRCGYLRYIINMFVTWLLCGLWHGASGHFVFWGIYNGFFILLEKFFDLTPLKYVIKKIPRVILIGINFIVVNIGWVFFRAKSLNDGFIVLLKMLSPFVPDFFMGFTMKEFMIIGILLSFFVVHVFTYKIEYDIDKNSFFIKLPYIIRIIGYALMFFIIIMFSGKERTFIYFAF